MKTIATIIIINSQNVKSEHLSAVIITSVFKEESFVSAWMSSTEVTNTGMPNLPLDDLKSLRHQLAELHVSISYNTGKSALPDIYARYVRARSTQGRVHIYQAKHK